MRSRDPLPTCAALVSAVALFLLGGCTTPSPPTPPPLPALSATRAPAYPVTNARKPLASLPFPISTTTSLVTPEGRRWRVSYAKSEAGGFYTLDLEPSDRKPDGPLEKLSFSIMDARMAKPRLEESFSKTKAEFDPLLDHSFSGNDDDFVVSYHSPGYREHAVWRTVRKGALHIGVSYRERVGAEAKAELAYWTRTITGLPDAFFASVLGDDRDPLPPDATDPDVRLIRHLPREGSKADMEMAGISLFEVRPYVRFHPNPDFRFAAHLQGTTARVVFDLDISEQGSVTRATLVEATPPATGEAVLEAFRRATFIPARHGEKPVASRVRMKYEFKL